MDQSLAALILICGFIATFPGQQFKRHKDGSTTNEAGQKTKLSYLIYLNDDCEGGSTNFSDFRDVNGVRQLVEFIVTPTVGSALLFRHEHWHEGTVVTAGVKYLFRSDVFYQQFLKSRIQVLKKKKGRPHIFTKRPLFI